MNNDDKIMSLLTIAEDQLTLNAQRIETAEQREQRQEQAFERCLQRMAEQHNALHEKYEANLQQQSARFSRLLDRKIWLVSVAAPLLCGALIVWAYGMYLQAVRDELSSAEYALKDLKAYHGVLSETPPFVPVRNNWQRNLLICKG